MQVFQPNDTICNRYRVIRKLGAGAMGSVYLCEDSVESSVKVALKVLVSEDLEDQDIWAKGEYEALTRLRHPNLARVHNFGRIGDSKDYFIVSEFIKGVDLFSATEYLRYDELTDIIVQICRALEYIHSQGYVHFDIKPDNILVTRFKTIGIKEGSKVQYNEMDLAAGESVHAKPHVKLIDFGLAEKITGSFSFAIKGTLNYLAPEILNGLQPDKRADLYSLGVTLFQVANRDLPFFQEAAFGGGGQQPTKRSELFEIHMKKHPEFLKELILKLLKENAEERFQTAKEVIQFINKHSGSYFDPETPETRASYFYSSKLVGRRREINLLKDFHDRVFFPQRWSEGRTVGEGADPAPEDGQGGPGAEEGGGAAEGAPPVASGDPSRYPTLILIGGEMGSGKSRLLEEYQYYLKLRDFTFVSGNCYEGNRKAYQPFIEVLRQLVYCLGFDSDVYRRFRAEIHKLLPELRERSDDREEEGTNRPDKDKLCFIERISQLLIEANDTVPYVLFLNNLHWVDDASLDLLESIATRLEELQKNRISPRFLAILSIRPEEMGSDRLRELIDRWKEIDICREVPLRRLKYSHIQELLRSMLKFSEVPDGFVGKLMERTGGNPLFLVETLKTLELDGVIKNCGDSWVIKATNFDRIDIPQRMEDILGKRLEKLDPLKRELLEVLSVLDKPVNPKFLQKLKRFLDSPILVELRNLEDTGIIAKTFEGGKLHFHIAQPKVREIVYARIPEEKKRKYHGDVGALFLEIYRGREEEILEELAYHYQQSDQPAMAVEMAIKAGDRLKRIYANDRAFDFYTYVLDKLEGDPESFDQWVATHEKLGDLCTIMGRYEMADRSYSLLLEEEVRVHVEPSRVVKIFLAKGRIFEIQGDYDLALKCYKDARNYLDGLAKDGLALERIRVLNSMGWVYVCMGKYGKATGIAEEAMRLMGGASDKIEHAMVYSTVGSAHYFRGSFAEAIEHHRRSLQIKENLENIPEITTSLNNLGSAHLAAADYGEAADVLQRALKTSDETGDPYGKAMSLHNLARLCFAVGQTEKGWESLDESLKLSKVHNMRYLNIMNYLVRGKALVEAGDCAKAEGNFFRALTSFSKQANRWGLCTVLIPFAALHRRAGNFKEAMTMIAEARQHAVDLDIPYLQAECLLEEARLRRAQGDDGAEPALRVLEEALRVAERCVQPELLTDVHMEIAETQVRLRLLQEASRSYEHAEEKLREVVDNLPQAFRQSYQARQRLRFPNWKAKASRSEVVPAVRTSTEPPPSRSRAEAPAARTPVARVEDSLQRANNLMVTLMSGLPLREFLGRMLQDIAEILSADAAFSLFIQADSVSIDASRCAPGKDVGDPEGLICLPLLERALQQRQPILLADTADDPDVNGELEAAGISCSSLAIAPFLVDAECRGVLYLVNPQLPGGGGDASLRLITPFLNLAPIAFHQLAREAIVE